MPELDPLFYLVAIPAVLLTGIGKGGLSGLGILAVPMMAMVIPPVQAAGIMLPILCLMDLFGLWAYRHSWSRAHMRVMVPGALIGIALGTLTFGHLNDSAVRLVIGLIGVLFALNYWGKLALARSADSRPARHSSARGLFWSGLCGFTSFIAHAGGPPIMVYLLPQRLEKTLLAGTTVVLFGVVNFVKLVPYAWLGQLGTANLTAALALAPLAPLGIWMGVWLTRRVNERLFYRFSHALLFIAGAKLTTDGLRGLGWL